MLIGPLLGCQLPASLSELRQEEEGTEAQDEGVQAQKGEGCGARRAKQLESTWRASMSEG